MLVSLVAADLNHVRLCHGMVVGNDSQRAQFLSWNVVLRGKMGNLIDVFSLDAKHGASFFDMEFDTTARIVELSLKVFQQLIDVGLCHTAEDLGECSSCHRLRSEKQCRLGEGQIVSGMVLGYVARIQW